MVLMRQTDVIRFVALEGHVSRGMQALRASVEWDGVGKYVTNVRPVIMEPTVNVSEVPLVASLRGLADNVACANNCTQCDDGLAGTGACLGTKTDSLKRELCLLLDTWQS